jgi:tight adherence protein C
MNEQIRAAIEGQSLFAIYTIALCAGMSVFLFILVIRELNKMVDEEDRTYMDPLPPALKLFWPIIQIISHFFCSFLPYQMMERIEKRLQRTGVSYLLIAEQFVAIRIMSTISGFLGGIIIINALNQQQPIWVLLSTILGYILPDMWLSDNRKRRELAVIRAMPVYLDFITMAVQAGLNLQGALGQAMEKAPESPLRNEFGTVLRDLRAGLTRADALRRMADRLDIKEVSSFVSAMIQAEKMGASLATVLSVQAEQRRNERFQRAEKLAMEAPIKLVGPLIIFIFPVTFIVLGFPIVMKFLAKGAL